jgi:hypothetical protein
MGMGSEQSACTTDLYLENSLKNSINFLMKKKKLNSSLFDGSRPQLIFIDFIFLCYGCEGKNMSLNSFFELPFVQQLSQIKRFSSF